MSGAVDLEKSQLRPFLPASRHFDSFISDSSRSPSFQHTSGDALQDEFGYGPYPYGTSSRRMSSLSSVSSMPRFSAPYSERPPGSPLHNSTLASQASSSEEPVFIWHTSDPEPDDALHDPSIPYTRNGKVVHDRFVLCSVRGWMNIGMLLLLAGALLMLFLGYPVFLQVRDHAFKRPTFETSSLVNSTGQVPDLKL